MSATSASDKKRNINGGLRFTPKIIEDNQFTTKVDTSIGFQSKQTLGVERELRRFAMNEYLKKRDPEILVGTNVEEIDNDNPALDDDLLLTNAITENKAQDEIDKTRYFKE